jgi:hypothetical protein
MTKPKKRTHALAPQSGAPAYVPSKVFPVRVIAGATEAEQAQQIAADLTAPEAAAARVILAADSKTVFGEMMDVPGTLAELRRVARDVNAGDLSHAEAMLVNQAQAMQSLSTRLIERGLGQDGLPQFEAFMRLGLKAQAQSRLAIEALASLKHGPIMLARGQFNVASGPQQVNNGPSPRAANSETSPNKLSGAHELRSDCGAQGRATRSNSKMAAVGEINRTEKR